MTRSLAGSYLIPLLTIGTLFRGNDVGFGAILKAYVFQWNPLFGNDKAAPDKACDHVVNEALDKINRDLPAAIETIITVNKARLSTPKESAGALYLTVYARFVDSTTDQCDEVSWLF